MRLEADMDCRAKPTRFVAPEADVPALPSEPFGAILTSNKQAYEGVKALIDRRNEILQEPLARWQAVMKDVTGPEAMSKQAEAAKRGVERTVTNLRELSQLEGQPISVWKVVHMRENLQKPLQLD